MELINRLHMTNIAIVQNILNLILEDTDLFEQFRSELDISEDKLEEALSIEIIEEKF